MFNTGHKFDFEYQELQTEGWGGEEGLMSLLVSIHCQIKAGTKYSQFFYNRQPLPWVEENVGAYRKNQH